MTRVITFGEIMLRLKSPGYERLFQSSMLEATFGGGEANVAISLAQFGMDTSFVSILPKDDLSNACIMELRKYGVDTSHIQYGQGRLGIYFLESGANQRPSKVIYDRTGSSFAIGSRKGIEWEKIFKNAQWFHITGISPALSENAADLTIDAVMMAKQMGLTVSCDLNYRAKLWKYNRTPQEVMGKIIKYADICIANEEDIQKSLGMNSDISVEKENLEYDKYKSLIGMLMKKYPNIKLTAVTLRESISANNNNWSACLSDGKEFVHSKKYFINDIVDRVGTGDSFSAGLIYGLNHYQNNVDALEFAVAASCLKHSIVGDFNRTSVSEIELLMNGGVSGRIKR